MPRRFAFLDTNTFLHYEGIDQIDWPDLLGCDEVTIVIAPIVIRELNRHKDAPTSPKIRDRAAAALKKLHDWSEQAPPVMIRNSVELQFRVQDPLLDFASEKLSLNIPDDHLVATMLEFRNEHPGSELILVTEDLGLKLKAGIHGLPKFQLPVSLRLPDELNIEQKRIKQLEQELKHLRDRMPAVKLLFRTEEQYLHVSVPAAEVLTAEALASSMEAIRAKYAKIEKKTDNAPVAPTLGDFLGITLFGIPPEDVQKYNEALDTFYAAYEKHLPVLQDFKNRQRLTARLDIVLVNDGTSPAEDIDIFMHFPDGFELFNEQDLPKMPTAPKAPARPTTLQERIAGSMRTPLLTPGLFTPSFPDFHQPFIRNVSRPSIRRTHSYVVEFGVGRVKHGFNEPLDPLYIRFESFESARSFAIDYRLYAGNLPDPVEGQLHVIVDRTP